MTTIRSFGRILNRKWLVRTAVILVTLVVLLTTLNYYFANRTLTEFRVHLSDDGKTVIVESSSTRGDFWNFMRSEDERISNFVLGSDRMHILKRDGQIWRFQQEVLTSDLIAEAEGYFVQPVLFKDGLGILTITHLAYDYILLTLEENDSVWEIGQNLSETVPELSDYKGLFIQQADYSANISRLLVKSDGAFFILKHNGTVWELEQEISTDLPMPNIDDTIGNIELNGDTLLISALDNDSTGYYIIFKWDGSSWVLEQEISKNQPVDGITFNDEGFSSQLQGNVLLLENEEAIYMLRRQNSTWALEQKITSKDLNNAQHCGFRSDLSHNILLVRSSSALYIFRYDGKIWELEREISDNKPVKGVDFDIDYISLCRPFWNEGPDLEGDSLVFSNKNENLFYLLQYDGSDWVLKQKYSSISDLIKK